MLYAGMVFNQGGAGMTSLYNGITFMGGTSDVVIYKARPQVIFFM